MVLKMLAGEHAQRSVSWNAFVQHHDIILLLCRHVHVFWHSQPTDKLWWLRRFVLAPLPVHETQPAAVC